MTPETRIPAYQTSPLVLSLQKDPLSLDGRGLEPAPYLIRG